ncbi:hypothetical protein NEUTE2DRAFT_125387 [Neurospora tetrasperma FGSC 2509]|nr:hypothetical protein NEUTE2DRAFT_125387 [Neurospora tetrasperma FGSC 2509]
MSGWVGIIAKAKYQNKQLNEDERHGIGLNLIDYLLPEEGEEEEVDEEGNEEEEEEDEDEEEDKDEEDEEANEEGQTPVGGYIQLQRSLPSYHETNDGLPALTKKKNKKTAMSQEK